MRGLKDASRRYLKALLPVLDARLPDHQDGAEDLPRWEPESANTFILRSPKVSAVEACLTWELHRVAEPAEYAPLVLAMNVDKRLAPYVDRMVFAGTSGRRLEANQLARGLVWEFARAKGDLSFEDAAFDASYATWLGGITEKEAVATVLAPLHPISFEGRIVLEDDLEITQLSDEEVAAALRMGAVESQLSGTGLAMVAGRTTVRRLLRLRRETYENDEQPDEVFQASGERENAAQRRCEEVVDALRVFKRGRVAVRGNLIVREGSLSGRPMGPRRLPGPPLELAEAEADELRDFWSMMMKARANPRLDAPIRRFVYAGERERADDQIVDLVAALEALVLQDIDDAGRWELGYRTRLRAALIIEAADMTRTQVQKQIRRAYSVRSAVAHGGTPRDEDLKNHRGEAVSLREFVESTEELVRSALKRVTGAVAHGGSWPPDWDALILEGKPWP